MYDAMSIWFCDYVITKTSKIHKINIENPRTIIQFLSTYLK